MSNYRDVTVTVVVRMSVSEKEALRECAYQNGRSLSSEIRQRALSTLRDEKTELNTKPLKQKKLKKSKNHAQNEPDATAGPRVQEDRQTPLPVLLNPRSIPLSVQEAAMHDYTEWKKSNTG